MGRLPENATQRTSLVLATVLGGLLALLLPLLAGPDLAGSATLAVVTLAFAALTRFGLHGVARTTGTGAASPATLRRTVPVLHGGVPDPVHHPLRPRAPGLA